MRLLKLFGQLRGQNGSRVGARASVRHIISLGQSLLSERGEISGTHLAGEILSAYRSMDAPARGEFFDQLVKGFSPDPLEVGRVGDAYRRAPSPDNLASLLRVVEPRRQELFRRLNHAPEGTRGLVEMRAQLLEDLKENPSWKPIEADLAHLLSSWFNRGFLTLRRIDWRTSASILDKLIYYEAVHEMRGWDDLRRRLDADRRCYAFFHPTLPEDPIIFIEVALAHGMSDRVQPLLEPGTAVMDPHSADCAVFYSITNCQKGLRGIPLGSFLIKQVVEDLSSKLPHLKTFATLSPVPGFAKWLSESLEMMQCTPELSALSRSLARLEDPRWFEDAKLRWELERDLVPLCAYYLLEAKQGKEPRDSVARFHLRNGSRLERINWLADKSATGMKRSAGLMVNYVYRLADVERNHELYSREYKIASSRMIETLAKRCFSRHVALDPQ